MGTAASIHQAPTPDYPTVSSHTPQPKFDSARLQPLFTTPNIFGPKRSLSSERKGVSSHSPFRSLKTRKVIKANMNNLNKAALLQKLRHRQPASQSAFEDCDVGYSTGGSQIKAICPNYLLNQFELENFDGNKTTTDSVDTGCAKLSPKTVIFHPQGGMYFNDEDVQETDECNIASDKYEVQENVSLEQQHFIQKDGNVSLQQLRINNHVYQSFGLSSKQNSMQNILKQPESEKTCTEESEPRRNTITTPEKQRRLESISTDRPHRRLNLKSKSANRNKKGENTTDILTNSNPFPHQGDKDLRNYGIMSEYIVEDKLDKSKLLNSDSKASVLPSERRTCGRNEESREEPRLSRRSVDKPAPKHKLLLQSQMKRERSSEALSSARGTRDSIRHEPTSAGRATTGNEVRLTNFTSPDKFELPVSAQPQVDTKWENFFNATNQMKKEMNDLIKDNRWAEDEKTGEVEQKQTSPVNMRDQQIGYFTYGTLSLSGSTPYMTNDNVQKSVQDFVSGNQVMEERKEIRKEIPLPFSPIKERRSSPKRGYGNNNRDSITKNRQGDSLNVQMLGADHIKSHLAQMKNSMESFDPPSSCYESNLTSRLDKEKELCVVDLLTKDNNSEYNRENYQSVLSDMNQKIDGILQKCSIITDRAKLDLIQRAYLGTSISHTLVTEGIETLPDHPATQQSLLRASPERRWAKEEVRTAQQDERIKSVDFGYYGEEGKEGPAHDGFLLKPCAAGNDVYFTDENEDGGVHENEIEFEHEDNNRLEADFERNESPVKIEEDYMNWKYEQSKDDGLYETNEDDADRGFSDELEDERREEELHGYITPEMEEEDVVKIKKTLEFEEELKEEAMVEEEQVQAMSSQEVEETLDRQQEGEQRQHVEDTFTIESDKQNDSDVLDHKHEDKTVERENDELESSFNEEISTQRMRNKEVFHNETQELEKIDLSHQYLHDIKISPKKSSPQIYNHPNSPPQKIRSIQDWNPSKYPSIEIQRATEELESLSRALERLPHAENFVSAAGLGVVQKALVDKIEDIHNDILERINQLNKKFESRSPLSVKRRDSIMSQEHTQDTRKLDHSVEGDFKKTLLSSIRDGSRQSSVIHTPNNYSTHAKTESKPQSYCPSPFQSQAREQIQSFEPGLTFGQGNPEFKGYRDLRAERLKRAQQREKLAKFKPKEVNLSIVNLIDTSADMTTLNTANNRSLSKDKADKHHQSIRQVVDHSAASKLSSPLSYRSSLLKGATRDGVIKVHRVGRSTDKDNELGSMLESTLSRDASNDKEPKKKVKSQNDSYITILGGQQILQQQITNGKEIREAFESRQSSSPLYMSHLLGNDSLQRSRKGSYSETKTSAGMNQSEEQWIQGEIEKKKKLAVELMNLSSLKKSRELEMPEDCMRKMEEWAKSETSSWGQIPTLRERRIPSQGVLKLQDYLANEGKLGIRELNEYPLSTLLAKENESVDTIFEECDSKRTTTREQGVQTVSGAQALESYYLRQRRESKENGRGSESIQSSRMENSRMSVGVGKMNKSKMVCEDSYIAKTPERKSVVKNIRLDNLELISTQRAGEVRSVSTVKKRGVNKTVEQYSKGKHEKMYTERSGKGLPKVSKSVRNNAVATSEMMQAYVLEQKERKYE